MQRSSRFRNPRPRILQSATELFALRSTTAVTIDDVAHAAQVSKASLYKEFATKDELVEAVVAHRSDDVHRRIREAAQTRQPGRERIAWLCADLAQSYDRPDFTGCLVVNTALGQRPAEGTRTLARDHIQQYYDFVVTELTNAGIDDTARVARTIVTLIEGVTLLRAVGSPAAPDLVTVVGDLIDTSAQRSPRLNQQSEVAPMPKLP